MRWRRTPVCWATCSPRSPPRKGQLAATETALSGQVSSAENVDMAATLSQLSLVQTQMQASYQLISAMSGLSLVNFLPR